MCILIVKVHLAWLYDRLQWWSPSLASMRREIAQVPIALVVQIVEAALVRLVRVDLVRAETEIANHDIVHAETEIANHEHCLLNLVSETVAFADIIAV